MEEGLDTGPVYMKRVLDLSGSAQEIYERAASLVATMIRDIIRADITPKAQKGKIVVFVRRKPEESDVRTLKSPSTKNLYDFIRMLDAETYPRAYLDFNGMRYEFTNARIKDDQISACVTIEKH